MSFRVDEWAAGGDDRAPRADDGTWVSEGIAVLEVEDGRLAGIDAFLDPSLLPLFGVPLSS